MPIVRVTLKVIVPMKKQSVQMVSLFQESRSLSSYARSVSVESLAVITVTNLVIYLGVVLLTILAEIVEVKNVKKQSVQKCPNAATVVKVIKLLPLVVLFSLSYGVGSGCLHFIKISLSPNMKFLLLNAQCFATANYDLSTLTSYYNIDILCLNETWENKNSNISLSLPNCRCFSRPRPTDPHGGVAAIIKQNGSTFSVDKCDKYNHQDLELLALIVKTNTNITFDLIVAYIPPEKTDQMKLLSDFTKCQ